MSALITKAKTFYQAIQWPLRTMLIGNILLFYLWDYFFPDDAARGAAGFAALIVLYQLWLPMFIVNGGCVFWAIWNLTYSSGANDNILFNRKILILDLLILLGGSFPTLFNLLSLLFLFMIAIISIFS
jgi:hypothetical protein